MKPFKIILALSVLLFGLVPIASADSITGAVAIGGTDTFTSSAITFNPTFGLVLGGSGMMSAFIGAPAHLTSFTYAASNNIVLFTTANLLDVLSFTINGSTSALLGTAGNGSPTLTLSGDGTFTEIPTALGLALGGKSYTPTSGTFSLTSSTTGITSFQLVSSVATAPTPEPASLLLLGTGLIGAYGVARRKLRCA